MAFDAEVSSAVSSRGMILADSQGDVEFVWEAQNDEKMRQIIEEKMKQGVKFYILKPVLGDVLHARRKLTKMSELKTMNVKIKDGDIANLFTAGDIALIRSQGTIEPAGGAVRVKGSDGKPDHAAASRIAAQNRTVGFRPLQGG